MKLLPLVFLVINAVSVGANDTVSISDHDLLVCRNSRDGQQSPGVCCDYHDCSGCFFKERCCHKPPPGFPSDTGVCECGVNDYRQGTCF
jgi:hypothetical protein